MKPNVDSNDNQINSDNDDTTEDVNHHIDSNINSKIFKNSSNKENSNNINDNLDTSIFGAPGFESTLSPGSPAFGTASSFSDSSTNMSINQSNSNKYKSNLDKPQNKSFTLPDMPINSYEEFANNFVDTDSKKELNENTNSSKSASSNIKSEESTQVDNSLAILADMYRKQGRDFYSNEDYVNALDSFSKALIQAPRNWPNKLAADITAVRWKAILFNNRAAAYMSLDMLNDALCDCNESIKCDDKYFKANLRRARVFRSQNRYNDSMNDYNIYLKSISNVYSSDEYNEISKEMNDYMLSRRTKPNNPPPSNNRWEKSPNNKNYNTNTSYGDSYQSFDKKYSNNNNNSSYGKIESDDEDDDCGGGNYDQWAYPRQGNYTKPQSPKPKSPNNKGFNYSSYYNNNNNQNQYERSYKASEREIKLAFRKLALLYHPDKNKDAGAEDMFKKITSAYTTLSDKSTRYKYDLSRP
eukprot:gene18730-24494_t